MSVSCLLVTVKPSRRTQLHDTITLSTVPPTVTASCSESGVTFWVRHQPFDHLWKLRIGSDLLTPELATQHGYNLSSDDQSLQLDVPMFSHGFTYQV